MTLRFSSRNYFTFVVDIVSGMWLDEVMTAATTTRPFSISARNADGFEVWAGSRTRTFATLDAARVAAFKVARVAADGELCGVTEIHVTKGDSRWDRRTVEVLTVEAL